MKSAMDNPQVISQYLESECRVGRIVGLLSVEEFLFVYINRFGVIPKSTPGKWMEAYSGHVLPRGKQC